MQPTGTRTYEVFIQRGAGTLICMRAWLYVGAPGHWVVRGIRLRFAAGSNRGTWGGPESSIGQRMRLPVADCVSMASTRELKRLSRVGQGAASIVVSLAEEENRSGKSAIRNAGRQERETMGLKWEALIARLITLP